MPTTRYTWYRTTKVSRDHAPPRWLYIQRGINPGMEGGGNGQLSQIARNRAEMESRWDFHFYFFLYFLSKNY